MGEYDKASMSIIICFVFSKSVIELTLMCLDGSYVQASFNGGNCLYLNDICVQNGG